MKMYRCINTYICGDTCIRTYVQTNISHILSYLFFQSFSHSYSLLFLSICKHSYEYIFVRSPISK